MTPLFLVFWFCRFGKLKEFLQFDDSFFVPCTGHFLILKIISQLFFQGYHRPQRVYPAGNNIISNIKILDIRFYISTGVWSRTSASLKCNLFLSIPWICTTGSSMWVGRGGLLIANMPYFLSSKKVCLQVALSQTHGCNKLWQHDWIRLNPWVLHYTFFLIQSMPFPQD